jgi:hypothetical protein
LPVELATADGSDLRRTLLAIERFVVVSSCTMSENEVPAWLLKAAQEANDMVQQMAPMLKAAQEANDMVRPYLPLLQDAQKYQKQVDEARAVMATVGRLPLPPPELVQVMNTGFWELFSSFRQQRDVSVLGAVATVSVAAHMGSVVVSEPGAATDNLTVQKDSPSDGGLALDAKTVFLAIMWVSAILLPLKMGLLSPEVQAIIRDYLVTVPSALVIHWHVTGSGKRD